MAEIEVSQPEAFFTVHLNTVSGLAGAPRNIYCDRLSVPVLLRWTASLPVIAAHISDSIKAHLTQYGVLASVITLSNVLNSCTVLLRNAKEHVFTLILY